SDKPRTLSFVPGGKATPKLEGKDGTKAPYHRGPRYPRYGLQESLHALSPGAEPDRESRYGKKQRKIQAQVAKESSKPSIEPDRKSANQEHPRQQIGNDEAQRNQKSLRHRRMAALKWMPELVQLLL